MLGNDCRYITFKASIEFHIDAKYVVENATSHIRTTIMSVTNVFSKSIARPRFDSNRG